jgi:hypothetical protein
MNQHEVPRVQSQRSGSVTFSSDPIIIFIDFQVFSSVADPGSGAFLTPGSGMGKNSGSGSGMNNSNHISENLETILFGVKILKFFDCGSGMKKIRIPGWKKFGSGIRNKHPGSATLVVRKPKM